MTTAKLHAIQTTPQTLSERVTRARMDLAALGRETVETLLAGVSAAQLAALDAAEMDALPPGVRERARRLAEHLRVEALTIVALSERHSQ